ncbi:MAG: elongation factor Ts, partial [Candidatus Omnitrophica bacterium]|nr:elongation factor Ts [Candidatus Omnitrophota bacterium]
IFKAQAGDKPANVLEKMLEGKIKKFYADVCLMDQPFVKNDKISVQDHLNAAVAAIGENVIIRRFVRYQLGEE